MSDPMQRPPARTELLTASIREMNAAHAVIADPNCDARSAIVHVTQAWHLIAAANLDEGDLSPTELDAWTRKQFTSLFPGETDNEVLDELSKWFRSESSEPLHPLGDRSRHVERSSVLRILRLLREVVRASEPSEVAPRVRKFQWARRIVTWTVLGLAFFLIATRPWELRRSGQWRGAYFPAEDFRGEPTVRRDRDIAFNWGLAPPMEDIPADRFGVRWDSCLLLDEETEAAFQLISDDGSRLFINEELLIDNWKPHKPKARGTWISLEPGVHHLRVEYFERDHEASIYLTATFDRQERPTSIPAHLLRYPSSDLDASNPCAPQ